MPKHLHFKHSSPVLFFQYETALYVLILQGGVKEKAITLHLSVQFATHFPLCMQPSFKATYHRHSMSGTYY